MPSLIDLMLEGRSIPRHHPWPRAVVDASVWSFAANELTRGPVASRSVFADTYPLHRKIRARS